MIRKLLRKLFLPLTGRLVDRFSSAPDRERIFDALTQLQVKIEEPTGKKGFTIPFDAKHHRFIIFSDQHKGRKNGADDFAAAEEAYVQALEYYFREKFHLVCLGDCEELWENTWLQVRSKNERSIGLERSFATADRFTKIFGNHDLDWNIDPLAPVYLKELFGRNIPVLEGVILETTIDQRPLKFLCTHGHQGDKQSDGNWFSKWFVTKIWAPWQSYLRINPNTPAVNERLKSLHNLIMYEWSALQKDLVLITGHTHQPVFESLTHLERLERQKQLALQTNNREWANAIQEEMNWRSKEELPQITDYSKVRPSYFNSGCCCFEDGDITGIEIADEKIQLIKWKVKEDAAVREPLESMSLSTLVKKLNETL